MHVQSWKNLTGKEGILGLFIITVTALGCAQWSFFLIRNPVITTNTDVLSGALHPSSIYLIGCVGFVLGDPDYLGARLRHVLLLLATIWVIYFSISAMNDEVLRIIEMVPSRKQYLSKEFALVAYLLSFNLIPLGWVLTIKGLSPFRQGSGKYILAVLVLMTAFLSLYVFLAFQKIL